MILVLLLFLFVLKEIAFLLNRVTSFSSLNIAVNRFYHRGTLNYVYFMSYSRK